MHLYEHEAMSVDVLPPSAPEYSHTGNLYPSLPALPFLPTSPDAFRLQKTPDVQNELEREADHYRQVANIYIYIYIYIYHCPHRSNWFGCYDCCAFFSWIATAKTGIGAFASVSIGGVAGITGISSTLLTGFNKKRQHKLTKHEKLYTLAVTKKNTISELVSKALNDSEFNLVLRELEKFHELKAAMRRKVTKTKIIITMHSHSQQLMWNK